EFSDVVVVSLLTVTLVVITSPWPKRVSPPYWALMAWAPAVRVETVNTAWEMPALPPVSSVTEPRLASPALKVTGPGGGFRGLVDVTVTVKVSAWPTTAVLAPGVTVVLVVSKRGSIVPPPGRPRCGPEGGGVSGGDWLGRPAPVSADAGRVLAVPVP